MEDFRKKKEKIVPMGAKTKVTFFKPQWYLLLYNLTVVNAQLFLASSIERLEATQKNNEMGGF